MSVVVVVVAPHPDDETLGCGGTLLRHKSEGDTIHWLIMTTLTNRSGYSADRIAQRASEIISVASAYPFDSFYQTDFETTRLDAVPNGDLIHEVSTFFKRVQPNTVYLPYRNDAHSDHEKVFDATVACTKSFRNHSVRKIRVYETLSETEFGLRPEDGGFRPSLFVDVTNFLDRKIEIMRLYQGEMGDHPFPRNESNFRALATLRGATAGCESAEAFMSLKEIWK